MHIGTYLVFWWFLGSKILIGESSSCEITILILTIDFIIFVQNKTLCKTIRLNSILKNFCLNIKSNINMRLQVQKITKYFKCKFIKNEPLVGSGLLRRSKSSPSWIFEALGPVPKVVADVLVFAQGIRGGSANFCWCRSVNRITKMCCVYYLSTTKGTIPWDLIRFLESA